MRARNMGDRAHALDAAVAALDAGGPVPQYVLQDLVQAFAAEQTARISSDLVRAELRDQIEDAKRELRIAEARLEELGARK